MSRIWNFEDYKNNTALIDDQGSSMSYDRLNIEACNLAAKIGHRCLVFALCNNEIGSVLGYTAFINNGIVPVMLNAHIDYRV